MKIRLLPCGSKHKHRLEFAEAAKKRDLEICVQLSKWRSEAREREHKRALVLGPPGSGKSTFLNSWRLTVDKISEEDRQEYKFMILDHIALSTQTITQQLVEQDAQFHEQKDDILERPLHRRSHAVSSKSAEVLRVIWENDEFRTAFTTLQDKSEMSVPNLKYFLDHWQRILSEDYQPTNDDIVHLSIPACPNHQVRVPWDLRYGDTWEFVEPGQYATTQTTWWPHFDDVNAIFYVVSLSEYDKESAFAEERNQFRAICRAPCFSKIPILLILNKMDQLKEKLPKNPLNNYFPEYSGENDERSAIKFIWDLFMLGDPRAGIRTVVYAHSVCALEYHQGSFMSFMKWAIDFNLEFYLLYVDRIISC